MSISPISSNYSAAATPALDAAATPTQTAKTQSYWSADGAPGAAAAQGLSALGLGDPAASATNNTTQNCSAGASPLMQILQPFLQIITQLLALLTQLLGKKHKQPHNNHADAAGGANNAGGAAGGGKLENIGGRQAVKVDGPGGFLWKPKSDSDGKLVVLVPKSMHGDVASIRVTDANGQPLTQGKLKGTFGDGRDIFRFDKSGESLPANCVAEVTLKNGEVKHYPIDDPALRHD